jgi:putative phosphoesterase
MRIGVISDTHDLLDPQVPGLFADVEHILHGGDVGLPWLVLKLEEIAPVTAVLGNTDVGISLRETEVVQLDGRKFLVHHIVNPHSLHDQLAARVAKEKPDVVIFGHTHKPFCETIDGILYLNPGYAGRQRFSLPRSLAILETKPELKVEFKPL